jgi:hypothetical protein
VHGLPGRHAIVTFTIGASAAVRQQAAVGNARLAAHWASAGRA